MEESEDFDQFVSKTRDYYRKNPRKFLSVAFGTLVGFSALIGSLIHCNNKRENEFKSQFEQSPPKGIAAYVVNDEVHLIQVNKICSENKVIDKFQGPGTLERLLWIDEDEIVFVGKEKDKDDGSLRPKYSVISDSIYRLNIKNGDLKVIFNPYSDKARDLFDDVKSVDIRKQEELREFLEDKKERGIKFVSGDHSNVNITNLGISEIDKRIYVEIDSKWYGLNKDGEEMIQATRIPDNLRFPNLKSRNSGFYIVDKEILISARLTNGKVYGCEIEEGARNIDWFNHN